MFQGFSDATLDFMWGIRFNNEKAWFEAHKQDYLSHFYQPMKALADDVSLALMEKYPKYGFIRKVSRIYRDARRLRGRGPYRDNLWFSIEKPSEQWTSTPVFWAELSPESFTYGLGYYMAQPLTMARLRARMDADPTPMLALTKALSQRSDFLLDGEEYKRPKGDASHPLLEPWYRKKSFSILHTEPFSAALYTPQLAGRLEDAYEFLMPFYDYFISLDGDPDPRLP